MITPPLAGRDTMITELMDDPDCDPAALRRTLRSFGAVNALVAGWRRCYVELLRPVIARVQPATLLDVGSGGGDLCVRLAGWARRDGLSLRVTGIDPDPRAHAVAGERSDRPAEVAFRCASTGELRREGARFDLVVSNHLLHHLDPAALASVLDDTTALARHLVLHNDIRRSRLAYVGWAIMSRPWARRTFVHHDGLISIRRSHTVAELAAVVPPPWQVTRRRPYRLLLTRRPETADG